MHNVTTGHKAKYNVGRIGEDSQHHLTAHPSIQPPTKGHQCPNSQSQSKLEESASAAGRQVQCCIRLRLQHKAGGRYGQAQATSSSTSSKHRRQGSSKAYKAKQLFEHYRLWHGYSKAYIHTRGEEGMEG